MNAPHIPDEVRTRADCYSLISRLFYAPTDAEFLQQFAKAPEAAPEETPGFQLQILEIEVEPDAYTIALLALQNACRSALPEVIRKEYDDLFVGTGKAPVSPYTGDYALPDAPDRHLLALREHLVAWGLVRRDSLFAFGDHVSAICNVMCWLIERERPIEEQLAFFDEFVHKGLESFCNAIEASTNTSFYRAVAAWARAFIEVEKQAFHRDIELQRA
jgi:TorA maturation chaperone TorD